MPAQRLPWIKFSAPNDWDTPPIELGKARQNEPFKPSFDPLAKELDLMPETRRPLVKMTTKQRRALLAAEKE